MDTDVVVKTVKRRVVATDNCLYICRVAGVSSCIIHHTRLNDSALTAVHHGTLPPMLCKHCLCLMCKTIFFFLHSYPSYAPSSCVMFFARDSTHHSTELGQ